jgi:hypothetical protein
MRLIPLTLSDSTKLHQRRTRQQSLAESVDVNRKLQLALKASSPDLLAASELRSTADLQALGRAVLSAL